MTYVLFWSGQILFPNPESTTVPFLQFSCVMIFMSNSSSVLTYLTIIFQAHFYSNNSFAQ